ncbi:MAG: nicotinamide mononucleotide transporter [Verrucomicrobiales bacterium]|nr:nicotinamide mononucleotide transporter [Verrucomicrobiales bacterium]MDB6131577.1 nicotinamide mononucleotide transporter [Verrucomicrobiales bacterium]
MIEVVANLLNSGAIFLAGRNSRHAWWIGILASLLFIDLFWTQHLYDNSAQQVFFIVTNLFGWWNWSKEIPGSRKLPIRRSSARYLILLIAVSSLATWGYEIVLHHFVVAARPFSTSLVLAFSILAQFLLMGRRIETWPCWLVVNGICIPVFAREKMFLTAALCGIYFVISAFAVLSWRRIIVTQNAVLPPTV